MKQETEHKYAQRGFTWSTPAPGAIQLEEWDYYDGTITGTYSVGSETVIYAALDRTDGVRALYIVLENPVDVPMLFDGSDHIWKFLIEYASTRPHFYGISNEDWDVRELSKTYTGVTVFESIEDFFPGENLLEEASDPRK